MILASKAIRVCAMKSRFSPVVSFSYILQGLTLNYFYKQFGLVMKNIWAKKVFAKIKDLSSAILKVLIFLSFLKTQDYFKKI